MSIWKYLSYLHSYKLQTSRLWKIIKKLSCYFKVFKVRERKGVSICNFCADTILICRLFLFYTLHFYFESRQNFLLHETSRIRVEKNGENQITLSISFFFQGSIYLIIILLTVIRMCGMLFRKSKFVFKIMSFNAMVPCHFKTENIILSCT